MNTLVAFPVTEKVWPNHMYIHVFFFVPVIVLFAVVNSHSLIFMMIIIMDRCSDFCCMNNDYL